MDYNGDDESKPWANALYIETRVDGEIYNPTADVARVDRDPGTPLAGRDHDRIYTLCKKPVEGVSEGVGPGTHRASIRARVPGTDVWLETNEVSFELDCAAAPAPDAGTDASVPSAPVTADAGVDAGSATPGSKPSEEDDDGCRVAPKPGSLSPFFALALWLTWRRSRDRANLGA